MREGELSGTVVPGDRRGRTIGFPTANIVPSEGQDCPAPGVYAALANGRPAAVNIGVRPTFAGASPGLVVEVHLLDFTGDLYGEELTLRFLKRLRGEQRFDGVDALVAQIERDVADARAACEEVTPPILWRPTEASLEQANLTGYMRWLATERGLEFDDYDALWRWSVQDIEAFWQSIWDFFDVAPGTTPSAMLGRREMPGATWFPGATLNYAEHALRDKADDQVAIVHASELRDLDEVTWGELREQVERVATGLRRLGVQRGDRVVAYLPNIPEAMAAFLACASIGAIWSSCSPDFGQQSVVDRFAQIEPKVLLAVDGYRYGGKDFDRRDVVEALREAMPSLEHTVLLSYLHGNARLHGAIAWDELVADRDDLHFEHVAFDHPLWVLYSSGTTGLPKGIVHGHGGMLLEHLKWIHLHVDARRGDRIFWFTTTGWMMWNFLAGCLLTDATVVLYDGNPGHPDLGTLWDLAERAGVTCFGTSASYIASCMKARIEPATGRDLSTLRAVGSTGSPLAPDGFAWVSETLGADTWLFSASGGSDLCTAFVGGCPLLPVYEGELQCRALGAKIEAWDEDGRSLIGEVGELVITEPMPAMPLYLWGDPDGERYRNSYFSTYPGVWRHGDWIELTSRGTAVIHGRSDSTINRGGIRMGTSEIYSAVLGLEEIVDALVVDVQRPGEDGWMPLFVVLAPGATLDEALNKRIARRIREQCSPRHVPDEAIAVAELPRTLSGKALEVPVKRILMGTPPQQVVSRDSLANPHALDWFVDFARRRAGAATR
jgi:acetoacetyl-CoA synthetase